MKDETKSGIIAWSLTVFVITFLIIYSIVYDEPGEMINIVKEDKKIENNLSKYTNVNVIYPKENIECVVITYFDSVAIDCNWSSK